MLSRFSITAGDHYFGSRVSFILNRPGEISMESERWRRIERLYYTALERDATERAAYLIEACAGDDELRREVEALLAMHEQAEDFMAAPALEIAAQMIAEDQGQPLLGRNINHYQVLSLLGVGGMGEVYLAKDTRLGRKVALKLLPQKFTQDRDRVLRFLQEARAASALNHPSILTIYEVGEFEGGHFIATEFIDGQTLRTLMNARLNLRAALDVATQVASALAAAHEAGIVHRDIKPENIMARRDGYIKVLDFGLAKLTERFSPDRTTVADSNASTKGLVHTDPEKLMGTARYMSPEQIQGVETDGRSDVFSLGVVLYEMVTGRAPFDGTTPGEVMAAIWNQEPPPLRRHARDAPTELERIVGKALQKDREERYQVIKDLLLDLKSLKLELEVEAKLKRAISPEAREATAVAAGRRSEGLWRIYGERLSANVSRVRLLGESESRELKQVFVQLNIVEEYQRPSARNEWMGFVDAELRKRRALFSAADDEKGDEGKKTKRLINPEELLHDGTRAVVTGAPGCGKSTLLRWLARRCLDDGAPRLPVFLELKSINKKLFDDCGCDLGDLLFEQAVTPLLHFADQPERATL